jgi:hypothetical protein
LNRGYKGVIVHIVYRNFVDDVIVYGRLFWDRNFVDDVIGVGL